MLATHANSQYIFYLNEDNKFTQVDTKSKRWVGSYSVEYEVSALTVNKSGRYLFVGSNKGGLQIFDLRTQKSVFKEEHFNYCYDPFYYLHVSNNEKVLIISRPHKFTFVNVEYIRYPKSLRSETFIQNTASFDEHPTAPTLLLVENSKIMIYDMQDYQWKKEVGGCETDVAYWVDRGSKVVSVAVAGEVVCWDAQNWTHLFKVQHCTNIINNTGIIHQKYLKLWNSGLLSTFILENASQTTSDLMTRFLKKTQVKVYYAGKSLNDGYIKDFVEQSSGQLSTS